MIKLSAPAFSLHATEAVHNYIAGAAACLDPSAQRRQFEAALASYLGVPADWVLCTNSCTAALHLFYLARRDANRNLTSPVLTWPGSWVYAGDDAAFLDVAEDGFVRDHYDNEDVQVLVDLWGRGMPARHLKPHPGPRVLDAAHHFGSGIDGLKAGHWDAVAYSFGPVKELTVGRGGALVGALCERPEVREMANVGTSLRRPAHQCGGNFEMPELAAAMGPAQLALHRRLKPLRQILLARYGRRLPEGVEAMTDVHASGHLMVIRARDAVQRLHLQNRLALEGIQSSIHYILPKWIDAAAYPNASALSSTVLSLPCHTGLTPEDVDKVCAVVAKAVSRRPVQGAELPSRRTSARLLSTKTSTSTREPSSTRRASRSTGRRGASAARRRSRGS